MTRPSAKAAALLALAVGGGLTLVSASSRWATLSAEDGLVGASVSVTGSALAPLSVAVGVVALAAVPAVLAVRALLRAVVAGVVALLGVVAFVQVAAVAADLAATAREWWQVEVGALARSAQVEVTAWPYATLVGLLVVVAGAGLVLVRGSRWSGLSGRYDAPAAADGSRPRPTASPDVDPWQALDRGDDPTETVDPGR